MARGQVELGDVDLVEGRGCDEEDLGAVGGDGGVGHDGGQVAPELVEGHVLVVCGEGDAGVVCAEEDDEVFDLGTAFLEWGEDLGEGSEGLGGVVPG